MARTLSQRASEPEDARALGSPDEVRQVLRYWLHAVRFESALSARPKARPPDPSRPLPSLVDPGFGQEYFRVASDHAAFFFGTASSIDLPLESALGFFERWLRRAYFKESARRRGLSIPRDEITLAAFPAILFKRRSELAGLFRFPVDVELRQNGKLWLAPPLEKRASSELPDTLRLLERATGTGKNALPLSVDTQLLHRSLGVLEEEVSDLTERWSATSPSALRMVIDVARLIGAEVPEATRPEEVFSALVSAMRARLPEGIVVYPTGIVHLAAMHATHHLERELQDLLDLPDGAEPLAPGSPLYAYVSGVEGRRGAAELRGRMREKGLTPSQLEAAERYLGSTFTSVEGPPGTGKTELIANLAAHEIVERAEALLATGRMGTRQLVVTSTNNRAVDNVIEVLARSMDPGRLPLALRTGSQDVTESITLAMLEAALDWLANQEASDARPRLEAALERFRAAREAAESVVGRAREARARHVRKAELVETLAKLGPAPAAPTPKARDLAARLDALSASLSAMLERLEAPRAKLKVLERAYEHVEKDHLAGLEEALPELALAIRMGLPPSPKSESKRGRLQAWEEALDESLSAVDGAREAHGVSAEVIAAIEHRSALESELAEIEGSPLLDERALEVDPVLRESVMHALFRAALDLRESWAVARSHELIPALQAAAEATRTERSLRRFLENRAKHGQALTALFPIVGCTLLSLGNTFSDEPNAIDHLVIDEAGQCHPAYAVSGLMRTTRALVIGDVHQLEPVIELGVPEEAAIFRASKVKMTPERFAPFRVHASSRASAQRLANRAVPMPPRLIDHFRCQPEIIALSDALTGYGLRVWTPRRSLADRVPRLARPFELIAIEGEQRPYRGSWTNASEAEALLAILDELGAQLEWREIAILTPYVAQLEVLRDGLRRRRIPFDLGEARDDSQVSGIATGTVHRFQGGERTVVLLSTVVTTLRSLRFLDDRPNLLNVAVSRARDHLLVLGHEEVLREGRFTRVLTTHACPIARWPAVSR